MADRMTMIRECESVGRALDFEVDLAVDIGGGEIDVVWTKNEHPNLPATKFGFCICAQSGDVPIRCITLGIITGLVSVCDQLIFVVPDERTQRSILGKIDAMGSIGGLLQFRKYASAITHEELLGGVKQRV